MRSDQIFFFYRKFSGSPKATPFISIFKNRVFWLLLIMGMEDKTKKEIKYNIKMKHDKAVKPRKDEKEWR